METLVVRGEQEAVGSGVVCVEVVDAPLLGRERVGIRPERVQAEQRRADAVELEVGLDALERSELTVVHPVLDVDAEVQDLVDLVEVDGVVQKHLVLRVLGEDRAPERDRRLELRRTREEGRDVVGGGGRLRGVGALEQTQRREDYC